ncbi:tetratricopeptide repeat protein [Oscillatoriales cyanobacterium LEGE 11467]|uniref:Tetratricopeptide repeat protein n=1 Tax=Zarconia navalis LEGE 11467 TaxID=1828826 RepID=A0A928VYG5_9CYAN|nr:tetratricopeptide repeat protein [Zarconia navalis]MBE9040591.1 tetratricopeptide repeat protein [Zarconia navalis LEGE 11467]
MTNSTPDSPRDRYFDVIDRLVETTLQGKIRSKEQVYQRLVREIRSGTGEIFERCLADRIASTEAQLDTKIKASRILKALQTIETQWQRWQQENQDNAAISTATVQILNAEPDDRLTAILQVLDPNQARALNSEQIRQLARSLQAQAQTRNDRQLGQLARGLTQGLDAFAGIEGDLISWIYKGAGASLGFGGAAAAREPWATWAKKVSSYFPQQLFASLARDRGLEDGAIYGDVSVEAWLELVLLLKGLQRGLVAWFDKQPYDVKMGKQLSLSTYLIFAGIWGRLSEAFEAAGSPLGGGCFQMMLQILRTFAQRDDFPLYGGVFASFSGDRLENTWEYLALPLRQVEGTQEKARVLTLLGYSQKALGNYDRAAAFHREALEISRTADDRPCEIASLNHLSRIYAAQKEYREAIGYAQRALILARQVGDRAGEANALANFGYSEVFSAHQLEQMEPQVYERAIEYLQQGLELSQRLQDSQSKALCSNSLGIACVILSRFSTAIEHLLQGLEAARHSGDLYLRGLNFAYLAEAYYGLQNIEKAIAFGCLGMYLLEQIDSVEWRQSAGLLSIVRGQIGDDKFQDFLGRARAKIIPEIGVDGFDYLDELLTKYQNETN